MGKICNSKVIEFPPHNQNEIACCSTIDKDISNTQTSVNEGVVYMDENKMLEKYLDKIDTDRRDQEQRIAKNIELMEERVTEERRLSEERTEKKYNEIINVIKESKEDTKNLISNIENKIDKLEGKMEENNKYIRNMHITAIIGIASMVIAVVGIVFAVFFGIRSLKL